MLFNHELALAWYECLGFIGFIFILGYNFTSYKEKKNTMSNLFILIYNKTKALVSKEKEDCLLTIFALLELLLISTLQYAPVPALNTFFGNIAGTGTNYYGLLFITPVILFLFCFFVGLEPIKMMDSITTPFPLALAISKLGCAFVGCCHGISWEYGIYNYTYQRTEVPIQYIEAGVALLLFIFLLLFRKKAKFGTMYPTYLILYSATRFLTEFLRAEEPVFGILKLYQLLCLAGILVGMIELLIVRLCGKQIDKFFKNTLYKYAKTKTTIE